MTWIYNQDGHTAGGRRREGVGVCKMTQIPLPTTGFPVISSSLMTSSGLRGTRAWMFSKA